MKTKKLRNRCRYLHITFTLWFPFLLHLYSLKRMEKAYLILATMLIDLDHLLVEPIFETNRCSINFHLLHTYYAMLIYLLLLFFRKPFRIIGIGLLFHMLTDFIDCLFMYSRCKECFAGSPAIELLKATSRLIGI
jgi:hypothetical protein